MFYFCFCWHNYFIRYYWYSQIWLQNIFSGDTWKKHRKILTPAFHFQILEKFVPVFVKNSHIFVNNLTKMVGQEIDIMPIFSLCALDIIFGNYCFMDECYYKTVQWKRGAEVMSQIQILLSKLGFNILGFPICIERFLYTYESLA